MLLLGVLQAQAAGAGPVVATDFDLLETQVLASSAASVTFSSLSTYAADYQHLQIRVAARSNRASDADSIDIILNADTGSNYRTHNLRANGSIIQAYASGVATRLDVGIIPANTETGSSFGVKVIDILDPFSSSKNTTTRTLWGQTGGTNNYISLSSGAYFSTTAVSSVELDCQTGSFVIGSRFSLYGIKAGA